jgi:hypothetical protein
MMIAKISWRAVYYFFCVSDDLIYFYSYIQESWCVFIKSRIVLDIYFFLFFMR